MGIMEKKMETTSEGLGCRGLGFMGCRVNSQTNLFALQSLNPKPYIIQSLAP